MEEKKAVHVSSLVQLCFYVHKHMLKLYCYNKLSQGLEESLNEVGLSIVGFKNSKNSTEYLVVDVIPKSIRVEV